MQLSYEQSQNILKYLELSSLLKMECVSEVTTAAAKVKIIGEGKKKKKEKAEKMQPNNLISWSVDINQVYSQTLSCAGPCL